MTHTGAIGRALIVIGALGTLMLGAQTAYRQSYQTDVHFGHGGAVTDHLPAAEVIVLAPGPQGAGSATDTCSASSERPGTRIRVLKKPCGLKLK